MQNDDTPKGRTRRSFIKRSAAAGVGAKSALIFGGLAMTSGAAASGTCQSPKTTYKKFGKTELATETWARYRKTGVNGTTEFVCPRDVTDTQWTPDLTNPDPWAIPDCSTSGSEYVKDGAPQNHGSETVVSVEKWQLPNGTDPGKWMPANENVEIKTPQQLTDDGWTLDHGSNDFYVRRRWHQWKKQKWVCSPVS